MTVDIPNDFFQMDVPESSEKIIMKIRGQLVDIMIELCPGVYEYYVVEERGQKVLYVRILKALYGMLVSSILFYKKFRKYIEGIGFQVNPYDRCVANKIVRGKQHTISWHVDDVKSSHVDSAINDEFHKWCEDTYGNETNGHVKVARGDRHDYLWIILDYSSKGKLKVDMAYYIQAMEDEFDYPVQKSKKLPWNEKLFKIDDTSKKLEEERREVFHHFVMKAMFLCKRGQPDINPGISFLTTRFKDTNENDWNKLTKLLGFVFETKDEVLTLEADDVQVLTWYVDAAFAVHPDKKSHTGSVFTLGKGAIISDSTKQKVKSRSSTESELIGIDDKISKVIWTKKFIEHQGFKIKVNIVYQDNESTIKLGKNGKESSGKRTRNFDIKYFYVSYLIARDELEIRYCHTDAMVADFMSKPLVGMNSFSFRNIIMNLRK